MSSNKRFLARRYGESKISRRAARGAKKSILSVHREVERAKLRNYVITPRGIATGAGSVGGASIEQKADDSETERQES